MESIRLFSQQEINQIRSETPGVNEVVHFNNAGSSLMPEPVYQAVVDHLSLEVKIGGYEAADEKAKIISNVYHSAAKLIGAKEDEIALVENATRGWDMAFYAVKFQPGDRILTCMAEYASNYIAYLQIQKKFGVRIEVIPDDVNGQVSVDALSHMLDEQVKLVSITHIPTNGGLINPVKEIGAVIKNHACLYLIDACQSIGHIPLNVNEIGCDMLSTTGRKYLRGPRGTGFLYVRKEILDQLEPPFLDLHAATWIRPDHFEIQNNAKRFENWESYVAGRIGLGRAIDYLLDWGVERTWGRIKDLSALLRGNLTSISGVDIHDKGIDQCGIISFSVQSKSPEEVQRICSQRKINLTTSSIYSTRLDMQNRGFEDLIRTSLHYYNTEEEIEQFCGLIESFIK
ncbi:MAG: aminotransferase class V-fold PLP-dependent enzyme [Anaerolineaceae bacterium]|nr:aminotransferase class V-fold PLP-dependent enzyme [Anaerolineaceae bacterium]